MDPKPNCSSPTVENPIESCLVCASPVTENIHCLKCLTGPYCSKKCEHIHSKHILCSSIRQLSKSNVKTFFCKNRNENENIVKLIGEKRVVCVPLDGMKLNCLWDTGSMVSVIDRTCLEKFFPDKTIHSTEDFLGGGTLTLSAANNSLLEIDGVVMFNFNHEKDSIQIPFVVTSETLTQPILGYNTISYLISRFPDHKFLLQNYLLNVPAETVQIVAREIGKSSTTPEIIGSVSCHNTVKIPANCFVKINGKVKFDAPVNSETEVLFSLSLELEGESELLTYETTGTVKKGKQVKLKIGIYNQSSKDIFLKKGTNLGDISEVSWALRLPARQNVSAHVNYIKSNTITSKEDQNETSQSCLSKIDLSHLSDTQKKP